MRPVSVLPVLAMATALLLGILPSTPAAAQGQQPKASAPKPYKIVAISPPKPLGDAGFETFRKQLAGIAENKDRKTLAGLIVSRNFFWETDKGDSAEKAKSGIDNLAKAIGLDAPDGTGWDALAAFVAEPTAAASPERKDTVCAPADPTFDDKAFEAMLNATQTDFNDWGFPLSPDVEVHAAANANAPVTGRLGMHFVRVMPDNSPSTDEQPMMRIVLPSGQTGYVAADALAPLGSDQICYRKESGAWKIAGFVGGQQ